MRRLVLALAATLCLPALASAQQKKTLEERREIARKRGKTRKTTARRKGTKEKRKAPSGKTKRKTPRKKKVRRARPKPRGPQPGPFAKGRSRFSLSGGTVNQFGNSYIVIGGGYGYFVANGLELGLDAAFHFGDDPSITTVSPNVRYIIWQLGSLKPYVGAFAQRQFMGEFGGVDLDDIDSVGARGGVLWTTGNTFLTVGAAYAKVLDCEDNPQIQQDCEQVYPEFGFGLSF
ncbi:MAG: hypothetical protein ACI9U2_003172 [Bradymonadia bacterium]|jgi:hypothetical protein